MFTVIVIVGLAWMIIAMIFVLSLVAAARRKTLADSAIQSIDLTLREEPATKSAAPLKPRIPANTIEVSPRPIHA